MKAENRNIHIFNYISLNFTEMELQNKTLECQFVQNVSTQHETETGSKQDW